MDNSSYCVLPWLHLYVGPNGDVLPCCQADHEIVFGNIQTHSVTDIKNNNQFRRLKDDMLNNRRNPACNRCYYQEDQGLNSERLIQNNVWRDYKGNDLVYFDIRLSNTCNLKCHMCSSYFSSSIAQEDNAIWGTPLPNERLLHRQRQTAVKDLLKHITHAKKLYFAGGEPLLSLEHWQILDHLIAVGNTNVELIYNTNFTQLHFKKRNITDIWKNFPNIQVMASLDAQGEAAEYSRFGTNWNVVLENMEKLRNEVPHVDFHIASTVSVLTVHNLIEWQREQHIDLNKWHVSALVSPNHLTLRILRDRQETSKLLHEHSIWCQEVGAENLSQQWKSIAEYTVSGDGTQYRDEFKRLIEIKDQYRKTNFVSIYPDLAYLVK